MGSFCDMFQTESGDWVPCPVFNGSNLSSCLSSMEDFLVRFQIPEIQWVNFASYYVFSDASSWVSLNKYCVSWWNWAQFTAAISEKFNQVSRHVQVSSIVEEEDEEQQQQDKVVMEESTFTQEMTTEESTVEVKVVEQNTAVMEGNLRVEESKGVQSEDAKEEKNVEADRLIVSANNLKRQWYNIKDIKSPEAKRKNAESNLLGVADRRQKKKEQKINIQSYHVHCVKSRELFKLMPEKDTAAYNAMIDASVTTGNVNFARELFTGMHSWTTLINGFAVNGYAKEALALLRELLVDGDIPVTVDEVRVAAELANAEKLIGDADQNQAAMNPINTVFDAKRFIGRRFSDASVLWPFKTTADQELKNWDNDFVKVDQAILFDLILAVNYLNANGGTPSEEKGIELILETEIVKADPASNLLTTRNTNICKRMKVHKTVELRVLPEDESWILFKGGLISNQKILVADPQSKDRHPINIT